jgi:cell division protein FtsX
MFLLRLSFRPWRKAPASQWVSAGVVGVLLVMMGLFHWVNAGITPLLAQLQSEEVLLAYLSPVTDPAADLDKEDQKVVDQIRVALGAHAEKAEFQKVSSGQFLDKIKIAYPDLAREIADLGAESKAIIPRYISVSGNLGEALTPASLEKIKSLNGVEGVETSRQRFEPVVGAFRGLGQFVQVLMWGLAIALFSGLVHLSRTHAILHRESLDVMRQWGASSFMVRLPGVLSGVWVGTLGGALASVIWLLARQGGAARFRALSPLMSQFPDAPASFALILLAAGVLFGAAAGLFSSGAEQK